MSGLRDRAGIRRRELISTAIKAAPRGSLPRSPAPAPNHDRDRSRNCHPDSRRFLRFPEETARKLFLYLLHRIVLQRLIFRLKVPHDYAMPDAASLQEDRFEMYPRFHLLHRIRKRPGILLIAKGPDLYGVSPLLPGEDLHGGRPIRLGLGGDGRRHGALIGI